MPIKGAFMLMGVRMQDIAQAAHVSVSTVSRALRGHPEISEETRSLILAAAQDLGYQRPEDPKQKSVGARVRHLIVCSSSKFSTEPPIAHELVLRGIREYAENAGLLVQLVGENYGEKKTERAVLSSADRVIFITPNQVSCLMQHCQDKGIPIAVTNRAPSYLAPVHVDIAVHPNEDEIALLIVDRLQHLGHQRIVFTAGGKMNLIMNVRAAALRRAMREFDLKIRPDWVFPDFDSQLASFRECLYLAPDERPTVVVCATDSVAIRVMQELHKSGLQIPRDISVIGIHNIPLTEYMTPSLTTVDVHLLEIGFEAARQIILYPLREPRRQVDVILPIRWVERASTRSLVNEYS